MLNTFKPANVLDLMHEKHVISIESVIILKEKRCIFIKGKACTNGQKQKEFISKEDAGSRPVSVNSFFISVLIEAKKGKRWQK